MSSVFLAVKSYCIASIRRYLFKPLSNTFMLFFKSFAVHQQPDFLCTRSHPAPPYNTVLEKYIATNSPRLRCFTSRLWICPESTHLAIYFTMFQLINTIAFSYFYLSTFLIQCHIFRKVRVCFLLSIEQLLYFSFYFGFT